MNGNVCYSYRGGAKEEAQVQVELDRLWVLTEREQRYVAHCSRWDWRWPAAAEESECCDEAHHDEDIDTDTDTRSLAVSYLMRVVDYFEEDRDIVHVAMNYLDRCFVSNTDTNAKNYNDVKDEDGWRTVLLSLDLATQLNSPTSGDAFRACLDYLHQHGNPHGRDGDGDNIQNKDMEKLELHMRKEGREKHDEKKDKAHRDPRNYCSYDSRYQSESALREHEPKQEQCTNRPKYQESKHHCDIHKQMQTNTDRDDHIHNQGRGQGKMNQNCLPHRRSYQEDDEEENHEKILQIYQTGRFYQSNQFATIRELSTLKNVNNHDYSNVNPGTNSNMHTHEITPLSKGISKSDSNLSLNSSSSSNYAFGNTATDLSTSIPNNTNTPFPTAENFASAQRDLLSKLNFYLHPPTPYQYTRSLFRILHHDILRITRQYARECGIDTDTKTRSSINTQSYSYATEEECNIAIELLTERALDQCDLALLLSAPSSSRHMDAYTDTSTSSSKSSYSSSHASIVAMAAMANAIQCTFPPAYAHYLHQQLYSIARSHNMARSSITHRYDNGYKYSRTNKSNNDNMYHADTWRRWNETISSMRYHLAHLYREQQGGRMDSDDDEEAYHSDHEYARTYERGCHQNRNHDGPKEDGDDTSFTTSTTSSSTYAHPTHGGIVNDQSPVSVSAMVDMTIAEDTVVEDIKSKNIGTMHDVQKRVKLEKGVHAETWRDYDERQDGENLGQELEMKSQQEEWQRNCHLNLDAPSLSAKGRFAPKSNPSIVCNLYHEFEVPPYSQPIQLKRD